MRKFFHDPVQRSRLWFGLAGTLTGLVAAALLCEPLFALMDVGRSLTAGRDEPPVVFAAKPAPPVAVVTPPPSVETAQRQRREGARSGDIQLTLTWDNVNDLDLHCRTPAGQILFFGRRRDRTGGVLDVDMNVRPPLSREPIENIYWPEGMAPDGLYRVYVHHFRNQGGVNPTPYQVEILAKGQRRTFNGVINPRQLVSVHAFTVTGQTSDLGGTSVNPAPRAEPAPPRRTGILRAFLVTALWAGVFGALLPLGLFFAQWLYLRQPPTPRRPAQIALTALRGLALGALCGIAAQAIFTLAGLPFSGPVPFVCYLLGWATLGGLMGLVAAALTPNVPRRAALVVGILSAALTGALFLPLAGGGDGLGGRFFGAALLGGAIGLTIALRRPTPPEDDDAWLGVDRFGVVHPQTMGHRQGTHTGVLQPPRAGRRARQKASTEKEAAPPAERKPGAHRWLRRERKS